MDKETAYKILKNISSNAMLKKNFNDTIIARGKEIYQFEKLEIPRFLSNSLLAMEIDGKDKYKLQLKINEKTIDMSCTCPCSFPCKHKVAFLFTIQNNLDEVMKSFSEPILMSDYIYVPKTYSQSIKTFAANIRYNYKTLISSLSARFNYREQSRLKVLIDDFYNKIKNLLDKQNKEEAFEAFDVYLEILADINFYDDEYMILAIINISEPLFEFLINTEFVLFTETLLAKKYRNINFGIYIVFDLVLKKYFNSNPADLVTSFIDKFVQLNFANFLKQKMIDITAIIDYRLSLTSDDEKKEYLLSNKNYMINAKFFDMLLECILTTSDIQSFYQIDFINTNVLFNRKLFLQIIEKINDPSIICNNEYKKILINLSLKEILYFTESCSLELKEEIFALFEQNKEYIKNQTAFYISYRTNNIVEARKHLSNLSIEEANECFEIIKNNIDLLDEYSILIYKMLIQFKRNSDFTEYLNALKNLRSHPFGKFYLIAILFSETIRSKSFQSSVGNQIYTFELLGDL